MQASEILTQARDTMTVKRVFGDPIQQDGVTIVPVAKIAGGGGGGGGESNNGESGSGAGFGINATPAGVYVIQGGEVRWEPAVDINRVIFMGQLIGLVVILTIRTWIKTRARNA